MKFPRYAKVMCKRCNGTPLEIEPFVFDDKRAVPVLVCNKCGNFYDPNEYDLTTEMLLDG